MLKTIFNSVAVKGAILGVLVFLAILAYISILRTSLERAEQRLEEATQKIAGYERVLEILEQQAHTEELIREVRVDVIRTIEASPNAETPVPTDIATAWATGIDRLRDAGELGNTGATA